MPHEPPQPAPDPDPAHQPPPSRDARRPHPTRTLHAGPLRMGAATARLVASASLQSIRVVASSGHDLRFVRGGPAMGLNSSDVLDEVLRQLSRSRRHFDFAYAVGLQSASLEPLAERGDDPIKAVMARVHGGAPAGAMTPGMRVT
ncbi:MAG: hypothetical protein M1818_005825 [Claussenomyces sp. TS43310]|nr:MAG: hypothetical protein M1818_005825 [Claussenomyces sp. TS43310]